jgi:serine/threonine protein kinase/WD40 repeat protein/Tfp pilus assembly protein PilF
MVAMHLDEQAIFEVARKIDAREAREAYLQQICGDDAAIGSRVRALLKAYDESQSFLESPAVAPVVTVDATVLAERPGTMVGPYKLLEQIGEGGFGLVFMAEQQHPVRRKVAVKVLKPGMDTRQVIARFEAERQALALMDHAHIARVLDAGETASGRPYFAMELVRGLPITEYCDKNGLTPRARLELFLTVCQAVQHAHQKGIIHRDIKPSNVLVTLHDGAPVAKVIDFGIAKALGQQLTDKTLCTGFAQLVGTPLYMSPEQAEMSGLDVDTRSDIYSLGVLLYELLTGTTPFDKERLGKSGYEEMRRIIREEEPLRPSTRLSTLGPAALTVSAQRQSNPKRLSQLFRGELDWIVMKALEKERGRRYETATAFAADVERYLHDEPVSACPPSAWYRFGKMARRNKGALVTATLVSLALVVGTAVSLWQAVRATEAATSEQQALVNLGEEQQATQRELKRTKAAEEKATRELFDSLVAQARANRLSRRIGQRFGTFEILDKAIAIARQLKLPPERFLEMRNEALAAMAMTDLRVAKDKEWNDTLGTALDFDLGHQRYARADLKGMVYVRRVGDGAEICRLPAPGPGGNDLVFSPDGRLLAVMNPDLAKVQVWSLAGKEPAKVLDEAWRPWDLSFSPDRRQLAVQHPDLSIGIFDLATAKRVQRLAPGGGAEPIRIAFNPKGGQLALVSQGVAQVHDLKTGKVLWQQPPSGVGPCLEWHPDGKTLAVGETTTGGDVISLWDVATGKQIGKLEGMQGAGIQCAFNHDGTLLASTGWGGILRLWDPLTGRQLFRTFASQVTPRFSPDGRFLAGTVYENKLRIWEIAAGDEYRTVTANPVTGKSGYTCSAISADGRLLASGADGGVGLWDLPSRKNLAFIKDSPGLNFALLEPSGALLTIGKNGLFRRAIRRAPETCLLHVGAPEKLPLPGAYVLAQSQDGRVLASPESQGAVVLHAERPDRPINLRPHADVRNVAVSPDGEWVATGGWSGGAKVWEARTGEFKKYLPVGSYCQVVFCPDSKRLLTAGGGASPNNGQIRAWEVGTWAEIPFKEPLKGGAPAFSPDGKLLVVETGTGVARLLDPKTGREYARLEDPNQDRTIQFSFSPDSTKLVCATGDGHCLHIWDLRAMRRRLAEMELDWGMPSYPEPEAQVPKTIESVIVDKAKVGAALKPGSGSDAFLAPLVLSSLEIAFCPFHPQPYLQRANIYFARGEYREAAADLTTALYWLPADPKRQAGVHAMRGQVYWRLNRDAETRADLEWSLQLDPGNANVCNSLAWFLVTGPKKRQGPPKALGLARQAVKLAPERWEYWNTLGVTYYRLADYPNAIVALERSLRQSNGTTAGFDLYFLAMCHQRMGDAGHARTCLDGANQWAQEHQPALPADQQAELQAFRIEAEEALAKK